MQEGRMRVLVACEFSGIVRDAFAAKGHDAWSCDLLPSESPGGQHRQCDIFKILDEHWDLLIAFPPRTHLAVSGARWFKDKRIEQCEAVQFVRELMGARIEKIAIENPVGILSTRIRKPDQIVQPWMFGHDASKKTCLWLKNLPLLVPTNVITKERYANQFADGQNAVRGKNGKLLGWNDPECAKERSRTYQGIAQAMADQWG
jgi:hypothetical protein